MSYKLNCREQPVCVREHCVRGSSLCLQGSSPYVSGWSSLCVLLVQHCLPFTHSLGDWEAFHRLTGLHVPLLQQMAPPSV